MDNETLTNKQCISLIVLTLTDSSYVFFPGIGAGKDVWLVKIIAVFLILPFTFIYQKLMYTFPKKNLYDILEIGFGKIIGNILGILYIWYFFHLGSLVVRSFGDIINTVSMPETPIIFPVMIVVLVCILISKYGIEVMGSWAETVLIFIIITISIVIILVAKDMDFNNLKPILGKGLKPILKEIPLAFTFPFGEIVIFTTVFTNVKGKEKLKPYTVGLLIAGFIGLLLYLTTILVIGETLAQQEYFPGFTAVSQINVGKFIQRVEILVPSVFIFGGVIKTSMCIIATSKGIAKLFHYRNYRFIVAPVSFMMLNVFKLNFNNVFEMRKWVFEIFPIYSLPFQVIIPIILYIIIIIKKRVNNIT